MRRVSLVPFYKNQINNMLFEKEANSHRDNVLEPYIKLREVLEKNGYEINTVDITNINIADSVIFLRFDITKIIQCIIRGKKSIYIQFEPPVVSPIHSEKKMKNISGLFDVILTWNDDLVDNSKFFKFYFPIPSADIGFEPVSFNEKKLLTNISGYKKSSRKNELYSKRIEAIKYFEKEIKSEFEFYGIGWDKEEFPSYKGKIETKAEVLKNYKFSLCFENEQGLNGLISEKIFDCFHARTIPIFWGAENVEEYIPKECFIDFREFDSYSVLKEYLISMDIFEYIEKVKAIEKYLVSNEFERHSAVYFAETVYRQLFATSKKKRILTVLTSFLFYGYYQLVDLFDKINQKIKKYMEKNH